MTVWLNHQCAAKGCVNTRDHGRFVGRFCGACDAALVTGNAKHGTSWIFTQQTDLRDAVVLLATANPGEDLPDQESADLWCAAVSKFLLKNQHLVGSTESEGKDPTPWCSGCGAMRKTDCHCGPIAENE